MSPNLLASEGKAFRGEGSKDKAVCRSARSLVARAGAVTAILRNEDDYMSLRRLVWP